MKALSISNLKKEYAGGLQALKGIDLEVDQGDFFALLGPNGAGKSTTIGVISSLVTKTSGQVKILDIDIDDNHSLAKKRLGVVGQEVNFNQFEKVGDIVKNQAGYHGLSFKESRENAMFYMKKLDIWDKRNEQARKLSGGMKRRVMVAKALVNNPDLLILDEPTAGVDIELRRSLWDFLTEINNNGTTIILTTHYLEEAEQLCRNIGIIDHGEIVVDTSMKDLLSRLDVQGFVLDLEKPLDQEPKIDGFELRLDDPLTLVTATNKEKSINSLFNELNKIGIKVKSMRNESNRLEELFIEMIKK